MLRFNHRSLFLLSHRGRGILLLAAFLGVGLLLFIAGISNTCKGIM